MAHDDDGSVRMRPSQSSGMKRNVWIHDVADHREVEVESLRDRRPVVDARAAERIHAQVKTRRADRIHVHDVGEVVHVLR